jgi:transposase InsO family protein
MALTGRFLPAAIFRQLCTNGPTNRNELSESTVNRFLNSLARKERTTNNQDMRRYERARANEVWCGDSGVGPYLKTEDGRKHKVYVVALIDDASRHIVGVDVFFNDNFANLMSVMKSAVAKFGVLKLFNFDNGGSHKNKQMDLLAARIGSTVHYDQPYTPTQKAKAERRFRTMKDQWMAGLGMRDFHTLDELRTSLYTYVNLWLRLTTSSMGPIIVLQNRGTDSIILLIWNPFTLWKQMVRLHPSVFLIR